MLNDMELLLLKLKRRILKLHHFEKILIQMEDILKLYLQMIGIRMHYEEILLLMLLILMREEI